MTRTIVEEQRRYKRYIHVEPIGFTHNMRPASVERLMEHIGRENIQNSRVLEVGCGQGYLVSHFLNLGAQKVIGTEVDASILDTIPFNAFQEYRDQGKIVEFTVEDFEQTPMNIPVDIITMFIGIPKLVYRLFDLFVQNENVQVIAFMKPNRDRTELENRMNVLRQLHYITITTFIIHLSGSGEQRQTIVLRKIPIIDLTKESPKKVKMKSKTNKLNQRLGLTKKFVSRHFSQKEKKTRK